MGFFQLTGVIARFLLSLAPCAIANAPAKLSAKRLGFAEIAFLIKRKKKH
jgi:hypothetical protein